MHHTLSNKRVQPCVMLSTTCEAEFLSTKRPAQSSCAYQSKSTIQSRFRFLQRLIKKLKFNEEKSQVEISIQETITSRCMILSWNESKKRPENIQWRYRSTRSTCTLSPKRNTTFLKLHSFWRRVQARKLRVNAISTMFLVTTFQKFQWKIFFSILEWPWLRKKIQGHQEKLGDYSWVSFGEECTMQTVSVKF